MDNQLLLKMIEYYKGDPKRSQHFMKVYQFAKLIGEEEKVDDNTMQILKTAALVHDIGIRKAEEQYGKSNGKLQEELGPDLAKEMLEELEYPKEVIDRVSYLVGHHHTYTEIDGIDYQILVEADFIVNVYEDELTRQSIENACKNIFRTSTGIRICSTMYDM